jgi:hypothetical protein
MALQDIGGIVSYPLWPNNASGAPGSQSKQINADGEKVAFILRIAKGGTLNKVGFRIGTAPDVSDDLKVSFQNVSGGDPDEVIDEFRTITPVANSWILTGIMSDDGTDVGVKRTVTKGDLLAVVIEFDSFTTGNVLIESDNADEGPSAFAYVRQKFPPTTWSDFAFKPNVYLEYDDGSAVYQKGTAVFNTFTTTVFNSSDTPDEIALHFTVPFKCRVTGAWGWFLLSNAADVVLYQGTTAQLTTSFAAGETSAHIHMVEFPGTLTLNLATDYYIALKPGASDVSLYGITLPSVGYQDALIGGQNLYHAERTDAGAWSADTAARPYLGILIDQMDDGAAGGGGETSHVF